MNMERVRSQNRALILDYINSHGPVSRKDIAAASGLTAASVTQITTKLLAEGSLKEIGRSSGTGAGRRKVLLDIDPASAFCFAINIEPDETAFAICDLKGRAVGEDTGDPLARIIPTDKGSAPEDFITRICRECRALEKKMDETLRKRLECVSVGITGLLDEQNALSLHAYNVWDKPVDLGKLFSSGLGLPVIVENNVDAFAAAVVMFGVDKTREDLLIIKWGPGVGSSIVIDNKIYKGRQGKAAELGHYIVDLDGELCSCGRRGCLETRVSRSALNAIMPFTPETFYNCYSEADQKTREKIDSAIRLFARCIVNAGTLLSPKRIVLAGKLFSIPMLRTMVIGACSNLDPTFNANRVVYTTLSSREAYVGPAAVFTRMWLLGEK